MNLLSCCCLLSLSLTLASATNQLFGDPPQLVTPQHPNVYVYEEDMNGVRQNLSLPCPLVNTVNVSYQWFRDGQAMSAEMVDETGTLTVVNITEGEYASQEGVDYYCVASRIIGRNPFTTSIRSRTIKVFYAAFGGFQRTTEGEVFVSVALNSVVALECDVVSANPPPQYRWYRDGALINEVRENNELRFLEGGRYLFIGGLDVSDLMSTYRCEVANAFVYQSVMAPTTYRLMDNLTRGVLMEYKPIGDLTAFVGNISFEFSFIVGLFSTNEMTNETLHSLRNGSIVIPNLRGIAPIARIETVGMFTLTGAAGGLGSDDQTVSDAGNLVVYQLPVIIRSPMNNTDLIVGAENLMYTCEFEGNPSPRIEWFFNGQPISAESGVSINDDSLMIASPQVSNSGIYQCIVSNEDGDDQASWLLEIRQSIQPSVIENNSTEMTAFEDRDLGALIVQDNGTTVNFFVIVMADPCPNITWFFNGSALGPSNSTFMFNDPCTESNVRSPEWNFTLSVSPLTVETSGSYTATFTNTAGTPDRPVSAYFTVPAPVSVTGLTLALPCLKEGQNITLRCNIVGFPRPDVQFSVNGAPITPGQGVYANFIEKTFFDEVVIRNVDSSAGGLYSCSANGSRATDTYNFCTVPNITALTATSNPVIGSFFFIQCTVSGTPMPTISWTKDGIALSNSDDEVLRIVSTNNGRTSRVEVSVSRSEFNGVYQCTASNDAGNDTMSLRIELQESNQLPLSLGAIIGIAVGGVVLILLIAVVILLLVCFYAIGKKASTGKYSANPAHMNDYTDDGRGNVDKDSDEEEGQPEAFNPQYESLPALRPSRPPSYKPTPSYPMGEDMELKKVPLDSDSYLGPPGGYMMQDNGMAFSRPGVDDFLSEDAQFV